MAKNAKPGDIFEIATTKGKAYLQNLLRYPQWGALIRVSEQLFDVRPSEINEIFARGHRFLIFFPLNAAAKQGIVEYVGTMPVPHELEKLPLFRDGNPDREGKVKDWWLWDGEREWKIGQLSLEQRKLPIVEIVNDTALIYYIETGYRPENIY
jgi:hypothetical protein